MAKKTSYLKPVAKVPTAKTLELADIIAAQLVDHKHLKYGETLTPEMLDKEVTYINASNGLFKVTKKPIGLFVEEMQIYETPVTGLAPLEKGVKLSVPKIPGKYAVQFLSWYRDVNTRDRTEASNLVFWNHNNVEPPTHYVDAKTGEPSSEVKGLTIDGQLVIYTPRQTNSGTLSEFGDDPMVNWLRENMSIYLEIHSHNTMNAFFSGTDDANENMTQFYAVWGQVDKDIPAFTMRYVVGDTRVIVPMSYVFDVPQIKQSKTTKVVTETVVVNDYIATEESSELLAEARAMDETVSAPVEKEETVEAFGDFQGPWPQLAYPADWMGQHTAEKFQYATGGRYGSTYDPYDYGYSYGGYDYGAGSYNQRQGYGAKGKKPETNTGKGRTHITENAIVEFKLEFGNPEDKNFDNVAEIRAVFDALTEANIDEDIAINILASRLEN